MCSIIATSNKLNLFKYRWALGGLWLKDIDNPQPSMWSWAWGHCVQWGQKSGRSRWKQKSVKYKPEPSLPGTLMSISQPSQSSEISGCCWTVASPKSQENTSFGHLITYSLRTVCGSPNLTKPKEHSHAQPLSSFQRKLIPALFQKSSVFPL